MSKNTKRFFVRVILAVVLVAIAAWGWTRFAGRKERGEPPRPLVVRAAEARIDDVDVYFKAIGTVTAPSTVTVRSRVDGELVALHFTEGMFVKEGDLLAEIDPRPFAVQKMQAQGQLARDEAQLAQARLELNRYRKLIKEHSVSKQQLETQEGLVGQYEGAVLADKAAVADADLQITYSRITAPISGRVGLRQVDAGNIIRSSDSNGIVVINQMRPMDVVFTLVEGQIPDVVAAMIAAEKNGAALEVEVWRQDNKTLLATGALLTIDNQIDTSTGTVRAKARFANDDYHLFPNQFVNARLRVRTLKKVLVVPTAAVQRRNDGFFVYVVDDGATRTAAVTTGYASDSDTVIESGLTPGEVVVTDGIDRLRDGMAVTYGQVSSPADEARIDEAGSEDATPPAAGPASAPGRVPAASSQLGKGMTR